MVNLNPHEEDSIDNSHDKSFTRLLSLNYECNLSCRSIIDLAFLLDGIDLTSNLTRYDDQHYKL